MTSCALLEIGGQPREPEARRVEAAQCCTPTANRTYRTSFAIRFRGVEAVAMRVLAGLFLAATPQPYTQPPCIVSLCGREPLRHPLHHLIAARARRRYATA